MTTETEVGLMQPQAKENQQPREAEKLREARDGISLWAYRGTVAMLIP